jgi:hypothetical protein
MAEPAVSDNAAPNRDVSVIAAALRIDTVASTANALHISRVSRPDRRDLKRGSLCRQRSGNQYKNRESQTFARRK